jgi:hypothetical protein
LPVDLLVTLHSRPKVANDARVSAKPVRQHVRQSVTQLFADILQRFGRGAPAHTLSHG